MLKLNFYLLQTFLKYHRSEKGDKDESFGIIENKRICILFLDILRHCQDFFQKLPDLLKIRNACIVFLLNLGRIFLPF